HERSCLRQLVHRESDVSQMSLGSFVARLSQGEFSFVAIPVFPSRAFRHSAAYVHARAHLARPEDLRGKRVGVAEYQLTANVWLRGILEDDHGVRPSEIHWLSGGLEEPGRREKVSIPLPADVTVEPIPKDEPLSGRPS